VRLSTGWPSRLRAVRRPVRVAAKGDEGFTLVELLVAFAALMILFGVTLPVLNTYLSAGNQVLSTYNDDDQLVSNQNILARLIRSEVEPAPATSGVPTPPFVPSSISTVGATFYANIGNSAGPAKIVMASSTPVKCSGCKYYTSDFTLTEYPPSTTPSNTCPGTGTGTACTWSSSGVQLININDVVNGQTNLPQATTPIFTYNTLNPTTTLYSPNTAISAFATCSATTCLADNIQSVEIDLQVETPGSTNPTPYEENDFVVYRLSSSSYQYSSIVG
jgi:Prokaryotic N-terminal methylation motif